MRGRCTYRAGLDEGPGGRTLRMTDDDARHTDARGSNGAGTGGEARPRTAGRAGRPQWGSPTRSRSCPVRVPL